VTEWQQPMVTGEHEMDDAEGVLFVSPHAVKSQPDIGFVTQP
jgi:hypothetical protein